MNTHKIFNLVMALMLAFPIFGITAPVRAQEPMPYFSVHPEEDAIPGWWRWPIGTPITFSVDNPGTPEDPDYAGTTTVTEQSPNDHSFLVYLGEFIDIKSGFEVIVSDGVYTKSTTVTNLQITMANPVTDTISGTAEPGSTVISQACELSGCKWDGTDVTRTAVADSSGNWVADYSVLGGSGEPVFDILPGAKIWHTQNDDDGDSTRIQGRVPRPLFMLNVYNDSSWRGLDAWNWPLGSLVTLTVHDPNTPEDPDYTEVQTMARGDDGYHPTHAEYEAQRGNFVGHPGVTITLSDGVQTKTMVVPVLQGTEYDVEADTISGITDPFASVVVACGEGAEPTVMADSDGNWIANFRDPENHDEVIFDVKPGTWCEPQMYDQDQDHIVLRAWWAPNPRIDARFHQNEIYGYDWPLGNLVTLAIDDPDNGVGVDYIDAQTVVERSDVYPNPTLVRFALGDFELENGQTVTMSNGNIIKTHIVAVPTITEVIHNTVDGMAGPSAEIWVDVSGATRHETADATGHWLADFHVPGDEDFETQTASIGWFTEGDARFQDEDGDSTSTNWGRGLLMLELESDGHPRDLYIRYWPGRSQLSITIDDPTTLQSPDYMDTQTIYWSEERSQSQVTFYWNENFDVRPGFTITVSDGYITKTMVVPLLTVTGYDLANDTISGRSDPFTTVVVPISNADGSAEYAERSVVADINGNWLANFAVSNNPDEVIYDVRPGDGVEAQTYEADWDHTVLRGWGIPIEWTLKGFYQPVDMNGIYNIAKNGSTVPFKFELFAGLTEITDTTYIQSFSYAQTSCDANVTTDVIETTVTGDSSLRYDATAGQFIYNWKTPRTAGKCYRVTMTTIDGSPLVAYFKLK